MKLSKETITLLKNFATINGNLLIKSGSKLSSISAAKSVYASAKVAETFPQEFGIYDLNEFLGALTMINDPEITFDEKFVSIKEGERGFKYFGADASVLTAPSKELKVPPADVEFTLSSDQVNMIMKTSGVLRAQDVTISGNGSKIKVVVGDKKNVTSSSYEEVVGETDAKFVAHMKVDNLKFIPGDYKVELSSRKIARFSNSFVEYVVSLEADSQFED